MSPTCVRARLLLGAVSLLLLLLLFTGRSLWTEPDPAQLLGVPLPPSATDTRVSVNRSFLDDWDGYIRFTLAPADLDNFLSDPAFQPQQESADPLQGLRTAQHGQKSLAAVVTDERPAWWQPEAGQRFLLAYRSTLGAGLAGPDAAWYIVDTTNPNHYTIYVYAVEV